MKNGLIFVLGLIVALGASWAGLVLGSTAQLGALPPHFDEGEGTGLPQWYPGTGNQGLLVYRDLGCASCHTQQVRRPDLSSDQARGWGDRQSVARDYIYQLYPQLGDSRVGPDLTNLAARKPTAPDEEDLYKLLYAGQGAMPAYRFLFEEHTVEGRVQRSEHALNLTGPLAAPAGKEIVPTARARSLVAYLLTLNATYDLPEARPLPATEGEAESPPAAPKSAPAKGSKGSPKPEPTNPANQPGRNQNPTQGHEAQGGATTGGGKP